MTLINLYFICIRKEPVRGIQVYRKIITMVQRYAPSTSGFPSINALHQVSVFMAVNGPTLRWKVAWRIKCLLCKHEHLWIPSGCATLIPELAGALRQGDPWDSLSSQTSYIHELQASERYVSQQNQNQTKEHSEK